ncbi:PIN domain-containing protein [Cyclobacterium amurskyense]|uniref:Putative nucleotide-binding protein n=2 Tax=Cyclobacterium amurskyense TaxID=320787 RepID=A0A0H4PGI9_9BACT|nr:PIN domain-containing protein [Cyclobacterium amurskyense]AKP52155.1 Putative nucleotide-binding protein [Cyclobacterium amurskyense]
MKVVVDTKIVFSALLTPNGSISDILLNSSGTFDFFTPTFLLEELAHHHQKLLKLSAYSEQDLSFMKRMVLKKIEFIDLELISDLFWKKAIKMTTPIDEFDAPFVALSLALGASLWTGDKKLAKGLRLQKIDWAVNTADLEVIRDRS